MKEFIRSLRKVPTAVLLILSGIVNYVFGTLMAKINLIFADITTLDKATFLKQSGILIGLWACVKLLNQLVGKVSKHKMLDASYMKWIEKLTRSKLSSISSISTGTINNAIHTISQCNKAMVDCVLSILPNIIPFIILCKKEWEIAGWKPVAVNLVCMAVFAVYGWKASNMKVYKRQAKARSDISTVTIDCIKNSQTVKYFNKEDWSIGRQESKQKETFPDQMALSGIALNCIFCTMMWMPTIAAIIFCWSDVSTVLYVIMMSYVIDNISGCISGFMETRTEKINQLEILGKLEPDVEVKDEIEVSLELRDVEFSYDPDNEDAVKFKVQHLYFVKGHRYCITGKSGFGKSTLAKLVTNTMAPQKGEVPLVKSVYMFAESEMFNIPIFGNIVLGEEADKKEILDMLEEFEVSVDLDVFKDPVGENGCKLSTGQKQRINLCRTLFYARRHPSSLIVMDEVTAALDIKTSIKCLEYLYSEFVRLGTTLIYISNKTDYLEIDGFITDNVYVHRDDNIVSYSWTE